MSLSAATSYADIEKTSTALDQEKNSNTKTIIMAGLALFAMFFGAGNLIFPLHLGANSGDYFLINVIGFLIAGVGVPILGLYATSLYRGNYWAFFANLGKVEAFAIVTFLLIIIGPFGAMPRIENLVYNTILPFSPIDISNQFFSIFFCGLIFLLAYKGHTVVSILGAVLSPIKIIAFSTLIFVGLFSAKYAPAVNNFSFAALKSAMSDGYSTMDLLATFFFCTVAFNSIERSFTANLSDKDKTKKLTSMIIKSSLIGGALISIVYVGFMILASFYASELQGIPQEKMVQAISSLILGNAGGLFVCLTVAFACLATGLALADVCSLFLYNEIFKGKVSRVWCLLMVTVSMCVMSNLSFKQIMDYMQPILNIIYPALLVLCVMNIVYKWTGFKFVKIPFYATVLVNGFLVLC